MSVSGPVDSEPETGFDPDHAPDAVHDVALLDDQVKVALPPLATVVGLAEIETVGAGAGGAEVTFTVTAEAAVPPLPEHVKAYVLAAASAPVVWEPDNAFDPDHAPEPEQEVALLDDQVKVALPPLATVVGLAEIETVGAGAGGAEVTFTVTAEAAVPPLPEHVKAYVLAAVSAPVAWEPDSDLEPDHAPEAVHDVALLDDQVKVALPPLATVVGLAEIETVGAGAGGDDTLTVTVEAAVPPLPEHVRTYVLFVVSAPVAWEPDNAFDPDHAPEPVHEVALLDDQVKVALPPLATVVGLAEIETVGAGAGAGGADDTFTVTAVAAVPPIPEHVKTYVLFVVSAPVAWEPDNAFDPDHAPEPVHDVAPALDHVKTDAAPLLTVVGFAESESVGAGLGGAAATSTVTAAVAVPPVPVHVRAYVAVVASAPVDWVPDSDLEPDQPSEAVHDVALLADQVSIELLPLSTAVGLAVIETVGAGGRGCTSIVIDVAVAPPSPAQVSTNVLVVESAPVV